MEILQIPLLRDNYSYVIHDPPSGHTAVVDPAEAEPVLQALIQKGWKLTHILNTHYHGDHVGGNQRLKQLTGCKVFGYVIAGEPIPELDVAVDESDRIEFGCGHLEVLAVPGHTRGHIAFLFPDMSALFCGDTLFAMGCGRLLGGTAEQLWRSLKRLRSLPEDTQIYCAHEYTEANGRFALTVEPENTNLQARMREVLAKRERGESTLPTILHDELATNPFLRPESPEIRRQLDMIETDPLAVFTELRRRKDVF